MPPGSRNYSDLMESQYKRVTLGLENVKSAKLKTLGLFTRF